MPIPVKTPNVAVMNSSNHHHPDSSTFKLISQ